MAAMFPSNSTYGDPASPEHRPELGQHRLVPLLRPRQDLQPLGPASWGGGAHLARNVSLATASPPIPSLMTMITGRLQGLAGHDLHLVEQGDRLGLPLVHPGPPRDPRLPGGLTCHAFRRGDPRPDLRRGDRSPMYSETTRPSRRTFR